jgi:hypothetical protein
MGIGMIEPYTAAGLIPSFWGIRRRADIEKNLEHRGHSGQIRLLPLHHLVDSVH